ncbi:MAG: hypothetical protein IJ514_01300 [Clostridia bacterium]|nr:hypothetical protein [Clostridia bacterium]
MEKFFVKLPLTGEYLTTVRLTTGGLCALAGFDVDTAEDFKVCVTESLLILKRNGYQNATIDFSVGEALGCVVCGEASGEAETEAFENEISRALLEALLGKVEFVENATGKVEKIVFES